MAGVEKVSEQEILEAAGDLLKEANGELRRVSARQVQKRSGGSNKRVNEIVGAWKERKAGTPSKPDPAEGPDPVVPDAVGQAIEEATEKLRNLGPLVGRLIEESARTERQRSDHEIAVEQQKAKAAIEEKEKDLAAAQEESHGYSEDLDRLETEQADLNARLEDQRKDLSKEREAKADQSEELKELRSKLAEAERKEERATEEAARQKELLERSDQTVAKLEAQLESVSETHRSDPADNRRAHRQELEAFRSDYKDIQEKARETAAELSEARATIQQLRDQLPHNTLQAQGAENEKK